MVSCYTVSTPVKFIEEDNEMNSILRDISTLRKGAPLVIDYENRNRYRLAEIESSGTQFAYYCASPHKNTLHLNNLYQSKRRKTE